VARLLLGGLAAMSVAGAAAAQQIDLSHGGPIAITASDGLEWRQAQQEVIANGNAKAVRDNVTITADRLVAWYRKKGGAGDAASAGKPPAGGRSAAGASAGAEAAPGQAGLAGEADTGGNEVYRVQAEGHVHIFTQTDQVQGDKATYDLDQAVMVVTGRNLKLTTPSDVLTARDDLEYWSQRHMAVARGDAVVVTNDGRRLQADTLVAYTTESGSPQPQATAVAAKPGSPASQDPLASSGKLQKVEAYGHVVVRTVTDTVTGDRAVYMPDTGIARVAGKVRITRGQNQLDGSEAEVNLKTGVSRLLAGNTGRVQGLVVPNDQSDSGLTGPGLPAPGGAAAPASGKPRAAAPRAAAAGGSR
jgi:lipopolysaccharide export system protein LptA